MTVAVPDPYGTGLEVAQAGLAVKRGYYPAGLRHFRTFRSCHQKITLTMIKASGIATKTP